MALHINGGCFTIMGHSRIRRIRAVASEGSSTLKTVEDKVKLGGSDLKVTTIGIGAWSWGDTTYWNNNQWNGNFFFCVPLLYMETLSCIAQISKNQFNVGF